MQLAHPQLNLYVDVDSPHSFEAVGCTACHDGSGQETDFVVAAHTPRNIFVDPKTGEPVLNAQLTKKEDESEPRNLSSMLPIAEETPGLHFDSSPTTKPSPKVSESGSAAVCRSGHGKIRQGGDAI